MRDVVVVALVHVAFAALVTAHVAIVVGLLRRRPRWRAAAGLLIGPLAVYWAVREHMRVRVWWWLGAAFLYLAGLVVS